MGSATEPADARRPVTRTHGNPRTRLPVPARAGQQARAPAWRLRGLPGVLVLGLLCASPPPLAAAQVSEGRGLEQRLQVRAGASCLEAGLLAAQVRAWLGDETLDAGLHVEVEGSATEPRNVSFRVWRGNRVLAHRSFAPGPERCEHLHAALGLAIALSLRASLLQELGTPAADDPAARLRAWSLGADALGAYEILPGLAGGLEARIERTFPPNFALRLSAFGLADFDQTLAGSAGRFDAGLFGARVDGCAGVSLGERAQLRVCSGLLAGVLYAHGRAFLEDRRSLVALAGFASELAALFELSARWSVHAGVSLVAPLHRMTVGVRDGAGAVVAARELAVAGFAIGLGPVYRF